MTACLGGHHTRYAGRMATSARCATTLCELEPILSGQRLEDGEKCRVGIDVGGVLGRLKAAAGVEYVRLGDTDALCALAALAIVDPSCIEVEGGRAPEVEPASVD